MFRTSVVAASVAAALALPAAAGASAVTAVTPPGALYPLTTFTGGPDANDLTFEGHLPNSFTWADAAQPLKAKAGCTAGAPVFCLPGNAQVNLGGGDDRFDNPFSNGSVTVEGGAGNDAISVNGNITTASGGADDDTIDVRANGNPLANGDGGNDSLLGGDGFVLKATVSGDGGDDLVVGFSRGDAASGGNGADEVLSVNGRGTLDGGAGSDVLVNLGAAPAGLTMSGGNGADTIVGTPDGTDAVDAGAGNDVIDVSGADDPAFPVSDAVTCGDGKDTVYADADDVIAADCEKVKHGPAPALPGVADAIAHLKATFPAVPTGTY
jgi:Ca2+-binding RTX toxin-like protein